jgi:hypothetical protein
MNKITLPKVILTSVLSFYTLNASSGEELFNSKCAMCHVKTRPSDKSTLVAPPAMGVMHHIHMTYSNKKDAVAFMSEYILNPQQEKAVCMPKSIKRFGLMPSQKGNITKEEAKIITEWMYKHIQPNKMMHNHGKKGKKASPFLITKGLPHMTKLVKMNWDNPKLNLTQKQKDALILVRKETMKGVKAVKPQAMQLEKEIKKMTLHGGDIEKINSLIDELSHLKAQATKIHVKCIQDTKAILSKQQLQLLMNK